MSDHAELSGATIVEIHKLFDALIAYMGEQWKQVNISAFKDPSGSTTCSLNCTDVAGNNYTYSRTIQPTPAPGATPPPHQ